MPVLQAAARAGYEGWLVIEAEQDPIAREPKKYKAMGLAALREMARATGLERRWTDSSNAGNSAPRR